MEAEERQLRERLIVLEEQRFLVDDMLATARRRRKFDDLAALTNNLDDLKREIDVVNYTLGRLDFAAVVGTGAGAGSVSSVHLPSLKINGEDPSGLVLS
ncbi:MAG: carboxypeptidase Y-deficient [Lichina confinis]|nr:MAG: carboxypeptidase Y-deficient [Lichina confinis]